MSSSDTRDADGDSEPDPEQATVSDEEFDAELRDARALLDPKDPPEAFYLAVRDRGDVHSQQAIQTDDPSAGDVGVIHELLAIHISVVAESMQASRRQTAALAIEIGRRLRNWEV